MHKLPTKGLIAAGASFIILQLSFLKPAWGKPLGAVALVLGLLAIILGIMGMVRAIRFKTLGLALVAIVILDVILGLLLGFYGLFIFVMS